MGEERRCCCFISIQTHSNREINARKVKSICRNLYIIYHIYLYLSLRSDIYLYLSVWSEWHKSRIYTVCFYLYKAKHNHNGTASGFEIIHDSNICIEIKELINPTFTLIITSCLLLVREGNSENIHFINTYGTQGDIYFIIIL